ncbi:MAG: hypothetical protein HUJ42_00900 [Malacoplasma sp.]|mgnify:CR=1 FL=1|nr:hypothetical protein [Malacoplasma sp.]
MKNKTPLNLQQLREYGKELEQQNAFKVSQNALWKNNLYQVCQDYTIAKKFNTEFSNDIKVSSSKITSQQSSGRCWIFATLNMIRDKFITHYNLENFEFSQAYLHFWDKFEKANVFLNQMIELKNTSISDWKLFLLLNTPMQEGGFFDWSKNLIKKYGLMPKTEMEDSFSSSNTLGVNKLIGIKLKQALVEFKNTEDELKLNEIKEKYLFAIYQILLTCYGYFPKRFDVCLKSKKNKTIRFENITPLEFLEKTNFFIDNYLTMVHTPYRKIKPFQRYELEYTSAIYEDGNLIVNTVDKTVFKLLAIAMILMKKSAWFACDVDHFYSAKKGLWAKDLYNFKDFFDLDFSQSIADHIEYCHTSSNHAMLLQGLNYDATKWEEIKTEFFKTHQEFNVEALLALIALFPVDKWKVENSWGEKSGNNGIFIIDHKWFEDYVYEVIINKKTILRFLKEMPILTKEEYAKFEVEKDTDKASIFFDLIFKKLFDSQPIKLEMTQPFNQFYQKGGKDGKDN